MKEKFVRFLKSNFIVWAFWAVALIIELTGVCVTSGKFLIRNPFMYLSLLAVFSTLLFCIKNPRGRYWCAFTLMLVFFVLDLIFIVVYDMTGSTFDFSMLKLRGDAMAIVESVPINFVYVLVCGISISAYMILARYYLRFAPAPTRILHRGIVAAIMVLVLALHGSMAYVENRSVNPADLSYKLYSGSDGTYYDRGIIGNFVDELYKGAFFNKVPLGDEEELESYVYSSQNDTSVPYYGCAEGYNVVTVLAESFEWFSFMAELGDAGQSDAFPYGFKSFGVDEAVLRELYPNLYRLYDTSIVGLNHHAREKTDISENQSILGNYPTDCLINYDYPKNTVPYSLPNILKSLYGVESRSYHNGDYEFYNRSALHENALGFEKFTAREQMAEKDGFTDYYALDSDRNLDSEMINSCKEEMFPSDRRFNTYITSITMHGQYEYRSNLDPYYETLAAAGIEATGIAADEMKDVFTYYAAMTLDFDKAIGIMFDYLENTSDSDGVPLLDKTIITVFGDHNAYYQTLSPYVKNLFLDDENGRNYTDLFRVPLMIHVGGVSENMPKEERLITKFTTTTDIIPTVLDLLGINYYNSLYYGHNLLAEEESIIYSRAYNVFITDKLYFTSINNIKFATPDVNDEYISTITEKALTLLDKTSHVNRIFYYDFLSGDRADTFYAKLKSMQN